MLTSQELRDTLLTHPLVQRLFGNPNWKPAASAAVDHFVDHKQCIVPSWIKSSTWAQVQMAYEEIRATAREEREQMAIELATDRGRFIDNVVAIEAIAALLGESYESADLLLRQLIHQGKLVQRATGSRNVAEDPSGTSSPQSWYEVGPNYKRKSGTTEIPHR